MKNRKGIKGSTKKNIFLGLTVASICSLCLGFFIGDKAEKRFAKKNRPFSYQYSDTLMLDSKKLPLFPVTEEKPIVIIIPSYNNEKYYEKNLQSVFDQEYKNYRVIYIDDCSSDKTYEKVKEFIAAKKQEQRVTLIRNPERHGAMENLYKAIHSCKDDEVVATLDGDDFFAHDWVLQKLNRVYANPQVWITYGQYVEYPSFYLGMSRPLPKSVVSKKGKLREYEWVTSHLRTFYAGLFKKIKLEDFFFGGKFLPMSWDLAMMYPMVEMAQDHTVFISDILYLYNRSTPINDDKVDHKLVQSCAKHVRNLHPYSPCLSIINLQKETTDTTDIVIFSYDRPMQLFAFIESIYRYVDHFHDIHVLYRASDERFDEAYEEVKKHFTNCHFAKQVNPPEDFKPLLMDILYGNKGKESNYVVFGVDDNIMKDYIDLDQCVELMKKTKVYGFYLKMGNHLNQCYTMGGIEQSLPQSVELYEGIYAWQFLFGKADWGYPNTLDMTIYKKSQIKKDFEVMPFLHPNSLEAHWANLADQQRVGLYFENSKVINIPTNMVNPSNNRQLNAYSTEELLKLFKKGLKIDIQPLFQMKNSSVHVAYDLRFVNRNNDRIN